MFILNKIIIISILAVFTIRPLTAFGESGVKSFFENLLNIKNEQQDKLNEINKEKVKKEAKLNQLDSEIEDTETQIVRAIESIESLKEEILTSGKEAKKYQEKILELESDIIPLKQKLNKLLPVYHELSARSMVERLLTSSSLSEALNEVQAYNKLSQSIGQPLVEMSRYQEELENARAKLAEYEQNNNELKKRKVVQKNLLESQKKYKEKLLTKTQAEIDELIRQETELAKRELEVEEEINKYLSEYKPDKLSDKFVKRGEIIGYQGDSGFSTGSHLHFTVFVDNNLKKFHNPYKHLDPGHLSYPLEKYRLTQGFGMTPFAKRGRYGGGPHNGIDIVNFPGASVKAAADGTIIMDKYFGSYGNAIIIDHGNNLYTLYGHLVK